MFKNIAIAFMCVGLFSGCASMAIPGDSSCNTGFLECVEEPREVQLPTYKKLRQLPPAATRPIVAVYKFEDLTGQRLSTDGAASNTAVSSGGDRSTTPTSTQTQDTGGGDGCRMTPPEVEECHRAPTDMHTTTPKMTLLADKADAAGGRHG